MLLPEAVPGELHLSRGVGALAPLALLAGFAGRLVADRLGRRAFAIVLAACLLDAAWSAKRLYLDYAVDPLVRQSFQSTDAAAARFVAGMCRGGPVRMPASGFSYEAGPVLRYELWREIRTGLVLPMTAEEARGAGFKPTMDFFRHPVNGEPLTLILGTDRYPADRRICVMAIDGLMETGRYYEAAGQLDSAEAYYRYILSIFPDSAWTWVTLGRLLAREGRREEAARAFDRARRLGYADPL
jgi:tetratricopeptide (TPR) repeat protein